MKNFFATGKRMQLAACILLVPVLLTGCAKTTPFGVLAEYAVAQAVNEHNSNPDIDHSSPTVDTQESEPSESSSTEEVDPDSSETSLEPTDESTEESGTESSASASSGYTVADGEYAQTIMVYMVGSDLESEYGNASLDLQEIMDAKADTEHNNIVVYTGGAKEWQISALSSEENSILLLNEDGDFSVIDTTNASNMGDADTLSYFINYCYDNFDSETYSLILWDHGGGPVLGFGVDENYKDLLTVREMQTAFEDSVGVRGERLEWVGFDACLMNSMEIADMLAPYTNYLIASQETEPGWGWCYSFLSELSDEVMSGKDMGELIIDYYMTFGDVLFEEYPRLYSDLTLSCIDLNQYQAAEDALSAFFTELDDSLNVNTYPELVRNREDTRDFGNYSTTFDYCMVDTIHLLERLAPQSASAAAAVEAIDNMIVYEDTNMSNACGISLCFPYQTDDDYTESCIAMQEKIDFASGYTKFLRDFNAIENGETLINNWDFSSSNTTVTTITSDVEGEGDTSEITLQLTEEQQANFASAGYHILCKAEGAGYITAEEDDRADEMYIYVHSGKDVVLDENGVLHAYYGQNAMYIHNLDTDTYSTIPLILTEKDSTESEKGYVCNVQLNNWNIAEDSDDWKSEVAQLQIVVSDEYPDGIIRCAIPIVDAEVQSASKQLIDLEDYGMMEVMARCSYFTRGTNGNMINFYEWEHSGWYMGFDHDLTSEYQLEMRPLDNPENYVCMFYVKDVQGNISYSELIPLQ